eukprot:TRINITY_DN7197_c0_g1_i2.p1 TRINITY_DN7197_c0_g1~~TRINITY_DN7197_c0_g1_i2.p1  ORF type:complete len:203 (+),score=47.71 TRINITY_DN7197_c0_g1_i2:67-609(+)
MRSGLALRRAPVGTALPRGVPRRAAGADVDSIVLGTAGAKRARPSRSPQRRQERQNPQPPRQSSRIWPQATEPERRLPAQPALVKNLRADSMSLHAVFGDAVLPPGVVHGPDTPPLAAEVGDLGELVSSGCSEERLLGVLTAEQSGPGARGEANAVLLRALRAEWALRYGQLCGSRPLSG